MKAKHIFVVALILIFSGTLHAQTDSVPYSPETAISIQKELVDVHQMNIVKLNLTALFFKNFAVQYERVIKKYLSGTLEVRFMPEGTVPYNNFLYNKYGDGDPDTKEVLDNIRVSNFAITPTIRFYPGKKGFGEGFYIAPAYRFAKFSINNIRYTYENDDGEENEVSMQGDLQANFGGIILGAQWFLGRHFTLDWWFFGPLYGREKANFKGYSTEALTPEDQQDIRENLEDSNIPGTIVTVNFPDDKNILVETKGPLGGISFGLSFGFRF